MILSSTFGYGISITRYGVVAAGFISLDTLADAIVDRLPFMTRISNGNIKAGESTLIMAIEGTVLTSYDPSQTFPALPEVNVEQKQALDDFVTKHLPGYKTGYVLSAFASA